ncbi:MAG: hypothetical protein CBC13_10955 [Planctomycetia bacterium TMED53]|nr:MAG: hypothetical protein CBC13_10955 [Planctomycetia bacterium TMED53]
MITTFSNPSAQRLNFGSNREPKKWTSLASGSPTLPFILLALLIGLSLPGCSGGDSPDPLPTLAEVKASDPGTVITTIGFVSVIPDTLTSTTLDSGFALMDNSGGIYVTVDSALGLDLSALKLGRQVQITGTVGSFNGTPSLALENAEDFLSTSSGGFLYFPQSITMDELNTTDTAPERALTIVNNVGNIVEDPGGSGLTIVPVEDGSSNLLGWELNSDDGSGTGLSFLNVSANINADQWSFLNVGQEISITGLLFNDGSGYEIAPRGPYDISISIEDARQVADGEKVLIKGVVGMVPGALNTVGEYGFSLHSDNGEGILISIADAGGFYTDYDGDTQLEFANGATLPFDLSTFHDLADPYPFALNSAVPIALHVEGVMATTVGGDRVVVATPNQVRRIAENLAYPISVTFPTGSVSSSIAGRWVNVSGSLVAPPAAGSPYPGGGNGWRVYADGYRATVNDGTGDLDVLLPYGIITDTDGDLFPEIQDLEQWANPPFPPFPFNIGDSITVFGFLYSNNGTMELIVASEGLLETSPGFNEFFIY